MPNTKFRSGDGDEQLRGIVVDWETRRHEIATPGVKLRHCCRTVSYMQLLCELLAGHKIKIKAWAWWHRPLILPFNVSAWEAEADKSL